MASIKDLASVSAARAASETATEVKSEFNVHAVSATSTADEQMILSFMLRRTIMI